MIVQAEPSGAQPYIHMCPFSPSPAPIQAAQSSLLNTQATSRHVLLDTQSARRPGRQLLSPWAAGQGYLDSHRPTASLTCLLLGRRLCLTHLRTANQARNSAFISWKCVLVTSLGVMPFALFWDDRLRSRNCHFEGPLLPLTVSPVLSGPAQVSSAEGSSFKSEDHPGPV